MLIHQPDDDEAPRRPPAPRAPDPNAEPIKSSTRLYYVIAAIVVAMVVAAYLAN